MERRAHWSDDLVYEIERIVCENDNGVTRYLTTACQVIAAVEDWQDARGDAIDGRSLTEAIFAVQRVRDVLNRREQEVSDMDPAFRMTVLVDVAEIRFALDGDA